MAGLHKYGGFTPEVLEKVALLINPLPKMPKIPGSGKKDEKKPGVIKSTINTLRGAQKSIYGGMAPGAPSFLK